MATAKVLPVESPCPFYVMDVETTNPAADVMARLEEEFLAEWEPAGNLKDPEKIEAKRHADIEKFRERAALLDAAPVVMVGLMFEDATFLLHGLKTARATWFGNRKNNVTLEGFHGEKALMEAVSLVLNEKTSPGWMGVGHNCYGFDLRRIRLACVRNGLKLPEALRVVLNEEEDRRRFLDTMQHFCKYFGRNGEIMISQDKMLVRLGIESLLNGVATGADVPGLLASGKINEVATKLLADLVGVRDAFLKMTGR
jgi:hypothetical protein